MERLARRELNKFRQQHGLTLQPATIPVVKRPSTRHQAQQEEPNLTEVTVDMKMEFCSKIKKLPVENLHKFVEKAMEIQKDSVAELDNEKF